MVAGLVLTLLLLAAAAFGVYCWFNPEVRIRSIDTVETTWIKVKSGVDSSIESVRREAAPGTVRPAFAPEPAIPSAE